MVLLMPFFLAPSSRLAFLYLVLSAFISAFSASGLASRLSESAAAVSCLPSILYNPSARP